MQQFVYPKTIVLNLLREEKKSEISIERILQLMRFVHAELYAQGKLEDYFINFEINADSLRRTVEYNPDMFELDISEEIIRITKDHPVEYWTKQYPWDDTLNGIVKKFIQEEN